MISILPDLANPRLTTTSPLRTPRRAGAPEAVLVLAPPTVPAADFAALPDADRWRGLHARSPATPGSVRTTTLGDARQTLAVLGYLKPGATAFERLQLAGKVVKEAMAREPRRIALASLAADPGVAADLDALLAASYARAFELPAWKHSAAPSAPRIERIELAGGRHGTPLDTAELARIAATARGNNLARWLTALPPNRLDARAYRGALASLARRHGLTLRWLDERALRRAGAGAFLAVSAGNADRNAGIAHLRYQPDARRRRGRAGRGRPARGGALRGPDVALVGKGILFDTGGTNLKPHRSMLDMHTDMAGSAVALASLLALAELEAPFAADAWLAITENRIGPTAYKPQDVVRAANGTTIQVIHTDAEGRMVLADTLTLAGRTGPRLMLDYATLTGACVYALTERMSGVFTNDATLVEPLLAAGRASGERVWNFPMDEDFDSDLESKVADVVQCAVEGKGDHILAARFLQRFVPAGVPWAHVDLAAATRSGGLGHIATDITGFGVRLTLELLLGQDVLARAGGPA